MFLPWSDSNAKALAAGQEDYSVELAAGTWTQTPQKYHARSLQAIRARYAQLGGIAKLDQLLEATGCRAWLAAE